MTKYIFIPVIKEVFFNNDDIDIDPTVIDKAKVRLFANFLLIKRKLSCADLNKLNKRKIENLWKKVITQKGKRTEGTKNVFLRSTVHRRW